VLITTVPTTTTLLPILLGARVDSVGTDPTLPAQFYPLLLLHVLILHTQHTPQLRSLEYRVVDQQDWGWSSIL
jgi:hypothetical protein